ncbi:H-2 class II histocompatibility antigen, A-U alpha chain-like isoform X2 [Sphaeramia orbicularis]|uniref:H-2 class II histocompatibility antigen, A-U alpha chain-like isoform X2 n=1 Tax=Sphaeramia orbicularis TaxID=375764 RepID=UPI00117FD1C4|nr:H-2 class II histocompatibility antigen, A-U alpha chain-like isoform X2 [Sphaeramia orbicularis]
MTMFNAIALTLLGAICISAQGSHKLCHTTSCFKSSGQVIVTFDGDELYHADFKKEEIVWESRVPTSFHFVHAYQYAVYVRHMCKHFLKIWKGKKSAPTTAEVPELIVHSRNDVIEQIENTLICFINHFFPPVIKTKWTKNGIEVETEDSFQAFILNPDGTFHLFSTLSFIAKDGDIYGCTVEHEALTEPKTEFFEVHSNQTDNHSFVYCGICLTVGFLGIAVGTFFAVKGNKYQTS